MKTQNTLTRILSVMKQVKNENWITLAATLIISILLIAVSFYVVNQRLQPVNRLIVEMQINVDKLTKNTFELELEISELVKQLGIDLAKINTEILGINDKTNNLSLDLEETVKDIEAEIDRLEQQQEQYKKQ